MDFAEIKHIIERCFIEARENDLEIDEIEDLIIIELGEGFDDL